MTGKNKGGVRVLNPLPKIADIQPGEKIAITGKSAPIIGDFSAAMGVQQYSELREGYRKPLEVLPKRPKGKIAGKRFVTGVRVTVTEAGEIAREPIIEKRLRFDLEINPDVNIMASAEELSRGNRLPFGNWPGRNLV